MASREREGNSALLLCETPAEALGSVLVPLPKDMALEQVQRRPMKLIKQMEHQSQWRQTDKVEADKTGEEKVAWTLHSNLPVAKEDLQGSQEGLCIRNCSDRKRSNSLKRKRRNLD